MAVTAAEACTTLVSLIEQVNDDQTAVEITSKRDNAMLVPVEDYWALIEAAHLLR